MINLFFMMFSVISIIVILIAIICVIKVIIDVRREERKNQERVTLFSIDDVFKDDVLMGKPLFETEEDIIASQNNRLAERGSVRLSYNTSILSNESYNKDKNEILSYKLP